MADSFMELAFQEAQKAAQNGEIPVGAVVVGPSGEVIASAGNLTERHNDPTAHAEIVTLRQAGAKRGSPRLTDCDLYVTLEPCAMCAAAISFARIRRVIFAAYDPKSGAIEHGARFYDQATCHHVPEVIGGIEEQRAASMLRDFFAVRR